MAKKFRVVETSTLDDPGSTPKGLGLDGAALWARVQAEFAIDDVGGREILFQLCAATDRAERCRQIIERDGELIRSANGAWRDHPLIRMELSARSFVVRTLMRLGIASEPPKTPGRSATPIGWRGPGHDDDGA